jgi:hypothetical protein
MAPRVGVWERDSERLVGADLAPSSPRAHHSRPDVSKPSFARHMSNANSMLTCYYNEGDGCGKRLPCSTIEFSDTTGMSDEHSLSTSAEPCQESSGNL